MPAPKTEQDREIEFFKRVVDGTHTPEDLAVIRKMIAQDPKTYHEMVDLCNMVVDQAIKDFAGKNILIIEAIKDRLMAIRNGLGYATAPQLEKLVIDEIALCWVRHYVAETNYNKNQQMYVSQAQSEFRDKIASATQRRYLGAIEKLARIRKLSLTVQFNIANRQVNVAGGTVTTGDPAAGSQSREDQGVNEAVATGVDE